MKSYFITLLAVFALLNCKAQNWKNYMGRPDERMCLTKSCYDSCAGLVKGGKLNFAIWAGHPETAIRRASVAEVITKLTAQGALQDGNGGFKCPDDVTYNECIAFKNYGACKACEKFIPEAEKGRIIVYYTAQDGTVMSIEKVNGKWMEPVKYKHRSDGAISVCSPEPGKVVIAYKRDDKLFAAYGMNAGTNRIATWYNYSTKFGSDPFIMSLPGGKLELFGKGMETGGLFYCSGDMTAWNDVYDVSSYFDAGLPIEKTSPVSADLKTIKITDKIVFGGKNGIDKGDEYPGYFLTGKPLGGEIKGGASAVAYGITDQAVFVRGSDNQVWWRNSTDGVKWSDFAPIKGMQVSAEPSAMSRKNGEIILFARGLDNKLYFANYKKETGKWSIWLPYGSDLLAGCPKAFSLGGDRIDVVFRNPQGALVHAWTNSPGYNVNPQKETIPVGTVRFDPGATGVKW